MVVISAISVNNFTFGQRAVSWVVESTTESLSDYELNIYRSEFSPQEDYTDHMDLVASGIALEGYDWIDQTITGYEYHQHRQFYYTVEPVYEVTGDIGGVLTPVTAQFSPDRWTRVIQAEQSIGIRLTGRPVYILKKRTFGTYCPDCYDTTLGRRTESRCVTCYDASFVGGYYAPITISGIINAIPKRQAQLDWGEWAPQDAVLTIESYPVLQPNDVVVDSLNRRWAAIEVKPTSKALSLIIQNVQIRIIPKDDIIYEFDIGNN